MVVHRIAFSFILSTVQRSFRVDPGTVLSGSLISNILISMIIVEFICRLKKKKRILQIGSFWLLFFLCLCIFSSIISGMRFGAISLFFMSVTAIILIVIDNENFKKMNFEDRLINFRRLNLSDDSIKKVSHFYSEIVNVNKDLIFEKIKAYSQNFEINRRKRKKIKNIFKN